ncbi:hypothetical protein GQR58_022804 [Nymphon striatum]|nr:hypothetical protein GQR58_022804 [Nymphon striatum]
MPCLLIIMAGHTGKPGLTGALCDVPKKIRQASMTSRKLSSTIGEVIRYEYRTLRDFIDSQRHFDKIADVKYIEKVLSDIGLKACLAITLKSTTTTTTPFLKNSSTKSHRTCSSPKYSHWAFTYNDMAQSTTNQEVLLFTIEILEKTLNKVPTTGLLYFHENCSNSRSESPFFQGVCLFDCLVSEPLCWATMATAITASYYYLLLLMEHLNHHLAALKCLQLNVTVLKSKARKAHYNKIKAFEIKKGFIHAAIVLAFILTTVSTSPFFQINWQTIAYPDGHQRLIVCSNPSFPTGNKKSYRSSIT